MHPITITTERLLLRQWRDADLSQLIEMNSNPRVMQYFPSIMTPAESTAQLKRIRDHFDKHGFGLFALERLADQRFLGFTGFSIPLFESFFTPCIEIGWRLIPSAWGHGFATEAAKACLAYGFSTLNFSIVHSFTSILNTPSQSVMKRIGMDFVSEFQHPKLQSDHALCRHVLYAKKNSGGDI